MKSPIAQIRDYCIGCGEQLISTNKSNYCLTCYNKNVNNVKTLYQKKMYEQYKRKPKHWLKYGIKITQEELNHHHSLKFCEICGKSFDKNKKHLDHSYTTGKYRGTLCFQCNTSLGKLGDNLDLVIERLTNYKKLR